jgi:hypothetical protein
MGDIVCDEIYMKQIRRILGAPSIDYLLLQDTDIKEICVRPALQKYFMKFPLEQQIQLMSGSSSEVVIPFPDDYTYGITDARVTDTGMIMGNNGNFWDIVMFNQMSGGGMIAGGGGAYNKRGYNPNGLIQQRETQRAAWKSYQNTYSTIRYKVDEVNRKVSVYTTMQGYLNITWARYSDNFKDVKYTRQQDVIELSQGYLLLHLADASGILTDSALEMSINSESLKTRGTELIEKVLTLWQDVPDVIMMHSS